MEKKNITMKEFIEMGDLDLKVRKLLPRVIEPCKNDILINFEYIRTCLGLSLDEMTNITIDDLLNKYIEDIEYLVDKNISNDYKFKSDITNLVVSSIIQQILIASNLLLKDTTSINKKELIIEYGEQILKRNNQFEILFNISFENLSKNIEDKNTVQSVKEEYYNFIKEQIIYRVLPTASLDNSNFLSIVLKNMEEAELQFYKK